MKDGCKDYGHQPSGSGKTFRQLEPTKLMLMGIRFLRLKSSTSLHLARHQKIAEIPLHGAG
jgi:hypothetical protein